MNIFRRFYESKKFRYFRVILIAIKTFWEQNVYLRASALTFYSLLSVVPIFALLFGIAKGFGFEKILENQIRNLFKELPANVIDRIITSANNLLYTTKGGMIAGIGLFALLWTILRVIGNIELAFNEIWGIKKQRSFTRKFSDYLSVMFICPILLIISSSLTVFIKTQIINITEKISFLHPAVSLGLKILPLFVLFLLFTFIYLLLPNTKVKFRSAIFAAVISGTLYQLIQWIYITFQIGVAKYNAIYGSLAALPLFMIWLQISWIIILFGAELSYIHQNIETFESDIKNITPYSRATLSIAVIKEVAKDFCEKRCPVSEEKISSSLKIPRSVLSGIIEDLSNLKLLCRVKEEDEATKISLCFDPHDTKISDIIFILLGRNDISIGEEKKMKRIREILSELEEILKNSSKNKTIAEI